MHNLLLTREQAQTLITQAQQGAPHEICGLLAGRDGYAQQIIPIPNVASDPKRHFGMDPTALLRALKQIDDTEQTLLGVYHSHPAAAAIPSAQDIHEAERQYPQVLHLIISLQGRQPTMQAWRIYDGIVEPAQLHIGTTAPDTDLDDASGPLTRAQNAAILLAGALALVVLLALSVNLLPPAPDIAEIIRSR
jgi:proteasome lid subunit RPN8/RPN11